MPVPELFTQCYVALRNIPYLCGDSAVKVSTESGGVLARGQTVWMKETRNHRRASSETAYVEAVGLVTLDPRWLVCVDLLQPAENEQRPAKHVSVK